MRIFGRYFSEFFAKNGLTLNSYCVIKNHTKGIIGDNMEKEYNAQPQTPAFIPEWDLKADKKVNVFPYDVYDAYDEEKDEAFLFDEY